MLLTVVTQESLQWGGGWGRGGNDIFLRGFRDVLLQRETEDCLVLRGSGSEPVYPAADSPSARTEQLRLWPGHGREGFFYVG